jgi:hypothetical protein
VDNISQDSESQDIEFLENKTNCWKKKSLDNNNNRVVVAQSIYSSTDHAAIPDCLRSSPEIESGNPHNLLYGASAKDCVSITNLGFGR